MPVVFLHGIADTSRVWNPVLAHLSRKDSLCLDLPGFGCPLPPNFNCTKEEYVQWLISQLEALPQPVDVVGHDWSSIFVVRIASLRPHLLRSWAAGGGPCSAAYEWHTTAKIWQSSAGEEFMRQFTPEGLSSGMQQQGVPASSAEVAGQYLDERMKSSILKLYRSAVTVGKEWEGDLAKVTAPGLVLWGVKDPYCPVEWADALAAATRAKKVVKFDCGHWFQLENPQGTAEALEQHWKSLDDK